MPILVATPLVIEGVIEITRLKPELNLRQKLWKGLGSSVSDVSIVKKDSLLVYFLKFFEILRVGVVVFVR